MEPFFCPSTRKKLPGKHGQQDLIAAPAMRLRNIQAIPEPIFSSLARLSLSLFSNRGLGEPWRFDEDPEQEPGRAWACGSLKGRTTDGEYASRRTFAADDAGTADRCRRQQRRERQYLGLQGRPVAVSGIFDLGRARRQLLGERPPRQLRPGPRHLPRFFAT